MAPGRKQAGNGKLGCILWSLLALIVVWICWKAIPVKIATSELYDFMVEQAKWAVNNSEEDLRKGIFNEAKRLNLPVAYDKIKVAKVGGRVRMTADFMVPLDFGFYTYDWDFNFEVDRPIFIF